MDKYFSQFDNYLLDNFPTGIYKTDAEGNFNFFNKGFRVIMEIEGSTYTFNEWVKSIHPADINEATQEGWKAREEKSNFDLRYRIILPSGKEKYIWSHAKPLFEGEEFQGFFGSVIDETEKYINEKKYQLSQNQFSELLNTISDIVIIHIKGIILYVNQGGIDITEYSKEEIIGSSLLKFTHPQHHQTMILSIQDEAQRFYHNELELTIVSKSGKEYKMIPRSNHLLIGKELAIATLMVDITKRKQAEQDLINAKNAAEEMAKAKSEFISVISHEIRTPLNGIIGMSRIIEAENKDPNQKENIEALITSGEILSSIVSDVLDFSKLDSGKMTIHNEHFNLESFLNSILLVHQRMSNDKGIILELNCDSKEIPTLFGDQQKLSQIINNLMSNAIKFTDEGKITFNCQTVNQESNYLLKVEISDTGIGISNDKQEHIFSKFYQAQDYSSRKYSGSGLGLSIVKSLVEILNGKISFKSVENIGTTFYFEIPFNKD